MKEPTPAVLKPTRLRSKVKQDQIVDSLRDAILDGTYDAGGRLPTQIELAQQFAVSGFTVQRAVDRLAREGFVRKRQRHGTRVVESPPHLTNLALVLPLDPATGAHYSKLYQALTQAAVAFQHRTARNVFQFHGVDRHADTENRQRLLDHLQAHQLAGIIFASPPFELAGTPILDQPGVPRVCLAGRQWYPHVPAVTPDGHSFFDKALDYLAARGRRRVAMLLVPGLLPPGDEYLTQALAKRGLSSPPHWQLTLGQVAAEGAHNCVRLLMHGAGRERPDGLIIADDNLVEHAQAGLIAAGARVPDDVEVIEHCNFPWPRANVLATKRLGYDINALLRTCVDLIDRQRRGEEAPGFSTVPAVFEEEMPPSR